MCRGMKRERAGTPRPFVAWGRVAAWDLRLLAAAPAGFSDAVIADRAAGSVAIARTIVDAATLALRRGQRFW